MDCSAARINMRPQSTHQYQKRSAKKRNINLIKSQYEAKSGILGSSLQSSGAFANSHLGNDI